jgi:hypothetical protein
VGDLFLGEKNGKRYGTRSNIAVIPAEINEIIKRKKHVGRD